MRLKLILLSSLFALASTVAVQNVEACYQESPSVRLRARMITGTITLQGKPVDGAVLRLHKFIGVYSTAAGHADTHVLAEVIAAKDGSFNFGELAQGKYVLFVGEPSGATVEIELIRPNNGGSDTLKVDTFGDSCISAASIAHKPN